jgi:hypothetical protein
MSLFSDWANTGRQMTDERKKGRREERGKEKNRG